MRCNNCNKFVSQDEGDPELSNEEISEGHVTAECRIVQNCQECSTELKDYTFNIELSTKEFNKCKGDEHDIEVEFSEPASTSRIEGKGRRFRTFYGATAECHVKCSCGKEENLEWSDECQASDMEECQ